MVGWTGYEVLRGYMYNRRNAQLDYILSNQATPPPVPTSVNHNIPRASKRMASVHNPKSADISMKII
jgi:hypothetical protein